MMNIERIFQDCGPNALGQVKVLHLIEWISTNLKSEVNFQVGDRALEDFHKLLDPSSVNPLIDQKQFESCMKTWLSGQVGQLLQEESRARHDSSNSSILNYSSGTLETSNHSFAAEDVFATCCCHEEHELRKKNSELESKVEKLTCKVTDLQQVYNILNEEYEGVRKLYMDCSADLQKSKSREHALLRKCGDFDRLQDELESKEVQCLSLEREVRNLMKKLSDKDEELRCFISSIDDFSEVESLKISLDEANKKIHEYSKLLNEVECEKRELVKIISENADTIKDLKRQVEMHSNVLSDISSVNSGEPDLATIQGNDVLPDEFVFSLYDEMKSIECGDDYKKAQCGHDKETQCDFMLNDNSQACRFETSVVFVETAPCPSPFIDLKFNLPCESGDQAPSHQDGDANVRTPRQPHRKAVMRRAQTSTPIHREMSMDYGTRDVDVFRPLGVDGDDFLESAAWFSKRVASAATMTDAVVRLSVACQATPSGLLVRPKRRNLRRSKWQSIGTQTEKSPLPPSTANLQGQPDAVGSCRARKRCRVSQDLELESEMGSYKTGWGTQIELPANLSRLESQNRLVDRQMSRRLCSELPVDEQAALGAEANIRSGSGLVNSAPTCLRQQTDQFKTDGTQDCAVGEGHMDSSGVVQLRKSFAEPHGDSRLAPVAPNVSNASSAWCKILAALSFVILTMAVLLGCIWAVLYTFTPSYMRSCRNSATCLDAFRFMKVAHFGPPPT